MVLCIAIVELTNVISQIRMYRSVTRPLKMIMRGQYRCSFIFGSMYRILFSV